MQLQNSYIFLPIPHEKPPKEDGVLHVNTGHLFNLYLAKAFPSAVKSKEKGNLFNSEYTCTIETDTEPLHVQFFISEVAETYFVETIVTGSRKTALIKGLEYIQTALERTGISDDYIEIISYDAVSEYYCNKIYPKLNELERKLRKLLFNIYIVNFGRDYYQATIDSSLQDKIKGVIRPKGNQAKKESEYLKKFFYSFELSDIQELLFIPHWTKVDEDEKEAFLKKYTDLSSLSDGQLRKAFSNIAPKSDWGRFFADKMGTTDVQSLLEDVRKSRNSIAHCKFFYRNDYNTCSHYISELNKSIETAIEITEEKDFIEKNRKSLEAATAAITESLNHFKEMLSTTFTYTFLTQRRILSSISPALEQVAKASANLAPPEGLTSALQSLTQQAEQNKTLLLNYNSIQTPLIDLLDKFKDLYSFGNNDISDDGDISDENE